MTEPAILFVNLRGVPSEDRSALIAARRLGYAVDLVAPSLPAHAAGLVRQFRRPPCRRQTTIGVAQISHSAIQHTSSS